MKVVLAFDSFKESMTNEKVAQITSYALSKKYPGIDIDYIPVSDGGEGSVDAIVKGCNGMITYCKVTGPHFETIYAPIGFKDDACFLESASVVGFKFKREEDTPKKISSYGLGELVKICLDKGYKKIYIGLGGTISNDGGCGMACSLGVKFYDNENKEFIPLGETLSKIKRIDMSGLDERINTAKIYALSDVTNPLYGENGASYVYAPQKGADDDEVKMLDSGLINLSNIIRDNYQYDFAYSMGAGAAGGLGYACLVFLHAKIRRGIETILDICDFDDKIKDADYIFTGEGCLDSQSFQGKVLMGIVNRASMFNKKVIGVFGKIDRSRKFVFPSCVSAVYETNRLNLPFKDAKLRCEEDLEKTVLEIDL